MSLGYIPKPNPAPPCPRPVAPPVIAESKIFLPSLMVGSVASVGMMVWALDGSALSAELVLLHGALSAGTYLHSIWSLNLLLENRFTRLRKRTASLTIPHAIYSIAASLFAMDGNWVGMMVSSFMASLMLTGLHIILVNNSLMRPTVQQLSVGPLVLFMQIMWELRTIVILGMS